MNARVKLWMIWGAVVAFLIIGMNAVGHLFRGGRRFSGGPGGMRQGGMMGSQGMMGNQAQGGMMGGRGGFGHHANMYGSHHYGGFHVFGFLLFLIIVTAIVVLVIRWLRKKTKALSMKQFIDTPFVSSHTPVSSMNGNILDQWEKSLIEKKENNENGTI